MLHCPLRSPASASKRLPGNAARSTTAVAASSRSSLSRAGRSMPENAFTRLPAAKSPVRLSRYPTIIPGDYDIHLRVTSCIILRTGPAGALEVGLVVVGFLPPYLAQTRGARG